MIRRNIMDDSQALCKILREKLSQTQATKKCEALFARHGHFPASYNQYVAINALKAIAYFGAHKELMV